MTVPAESRLLPEPLHSKTQPDSGKPRARLAVWRVPVQSWLVQDWLSSSCLLLFYKMCCSTSLAGV